MNFQGNHVCSGYLLLHKTLFQNFFELMLGAAYHVLISVLSIYNEYSICSKVMKAESGKAGI